MRKTKIICTLGPATDKNDVLRELVISGMNVARFNFSHADHEEHLGRFRKLRQLREELNLPVAALLDTKGPEIRIGVFKEDSIYLEKDQIFTLTTRAVEGSSEIVSVSYKKLPQDVNIGTKILIDDGLVGMTVKSKNDTDIVCIVENEGVISDNKGVNVPGITLSMPYISEKDREDIIFGIKKGYDFIAASFVRSKKDIIEIREIMAEYNCKDVNIIAKIENLQGVENIDEIISVSDGIMIARGDMGVEIPNEDVPVIQKLIIKKVYQAGKQVITATQMLDSMIQNPRPTRAETTDVANAIYDGTSAIMLSGETASGKYPIEALNTMIRITERTEQDIDYKKRYRINEIKEKQDITTAISHATCSIAHDLNVKAIITVTQSGRTARMISKFRPDCPIMGCATSHRVCRQLNLSWGVTPLLLEEERDTNGLFEHSIEVAAKAGHVVENDMVVITAGVPVGQTGTTNLLKVQVAGKYC
jgi:pyruvate kinase